MAKQHTNLPPETADPFAFVPMSDSLRALARRGELLRRRKGQGLINEGDVGDTMYIILQGELRAYAVGSDGREVNFGHYGPGEYVGEMGLDGGRRSANVDATKPTLCAMVTRHTLLAHLQAEPDFAFELLTKVIRRARAATMGMRQIALNKVYGRLRAELLGRAQRRPDGTGLIEPTPSHLLISQNIGCTREMVTRLMGDLEEGGYLRADKKQHRIELLRPLPDKW